MTEKQTHNFIVTGGCGFIGSHLVEALVLHGQNVLVIDDMRVGKTKLESKNIEYLHQDVASAIPVGKFDAIFHLAATPRIRLSQKDPFGTITNNFNSTMVVAEYARRERIPLFFAASSSTQFLHHQENPYTFSKCVSEEILQLYHKIYKLEYHMLYFYNVYGPREADYGEYSTVVRAFKKCVEKDEPLRIFGSGKKQRDFTHIHDVIDGILQLLTTKNKPKNVHLGSGNPVSIMDVAKAFDHSIVHEFDKEGEAEVTEAPNPYIEPQYDVIGYIKKWKSDFEEERILHNVNKDLRKVEKKYAKIDS
jgi:UDP-glucose 4-epimerase|tara:strand:- start:624 stop:1541 length:918 start_codon:yes stop_codon:yes gene_type:complete